MNQHRRTFLQRLGAGAALSSLPLVVGAHEFYAGTFTILHPWAEPTEPGVTETRMYVRFDEIAADDRLIGVHTPIADKVEMRSAPGPKGDSVELDSIALTAMQTVVLEPGGMHLLLTGLKLQLFWDRAYPVVFTFEHAGDINAEILMLNA